MQPRPISRKDIPEWYGTEHAGARFADVCELFMNVYGDKLGMDLILKAAIKQYAIRYGWEKTTLELCELAEEITEAELRKDKYV